jgi:NCAIR mutase (PurE)-related protein
MTPSDLKKLLRDVASGRLGVPEAVDRLRGLPFEDLGFARVDQHRHLRRGLPEIVFGLGKTAEQCARIVDSITAAGHTVLVTRANPGQFDKIHNRHPRAEWHELARAITLTPAQRPSSKARPSAESTARRRPAADVIVVTAGTSDLPVAEEAALTAETLGLTVGRLFDVGVAGIHRLVGERARLESARVLIVVAGMEGALPSVVAGLVGTPVIGVPTSVGYGVSLGGLTALFGMLTSCSGGLTVVNIDNGFGAAYSAALMVRRMSRSKRPTPDHPGRPRKPRGRVRRRLHETS